MIIALPEKKEIKLGKVDFVVEEVKLKETKKGDAMVILKLNVKDDEGFEKVVYDFLILNEENNWRVHSFGESIGMQAEFESLQVSDEDIIGKTGRCVLTREEDKSEAARFPWRYMVGTYFVANDIDVSDKIRKNVIAHYETHANKYDQFWYELGCRILEAIPSSLSVDEFKIKIDNLSVNDMKNYLLDLTIEDKVLLSVKGMLVDIFDDFE